MPSESFVCCVLIQGKANEVMEPAWHFSLFYTNHLIHLCFCTKVNLIIIIIILYPIFFTIAFLLIETNFIVIFLCILRYYMYKYINESTIIALGSVISRINGCEDELELVFGKLSKVEGQFFYCRV